MRRKMKHTNKNEAQVLNKNVTSVDQLLLIEDNHNSKSLTRPSPLAPTTTLVDDAKKGMLMRDENINIICIGSKKRLEHLGSENQ